MTSRFGVRPVTGVIGAEIDGVDLAGTLSSGAVLELRRILNERQVLIFRDQMITPQQQYDFAANFGAVTRPMVEAIKAPVPGITVVNSLHSKRLIDEWHTDHTFSEIPPMAGMLYSVRLPSAGGDTLWLNAVAAYEALSAPLRTFLDGLTAIHTAERFMRRASEQSQSFTYSLDKGAIVHPVVRLHPETARKALFVCPLYTTRIVELREEESHAVLKMLFQHMQLPEFHMRLRWQPHTAVLWDERSTLHCAVGDYDEPRIMHRLMIDGTKPLGVNAALKVA